MNIYMEQILKDIVNNKGKTINYLTKGKVLTCDYIVDKAIESKDTSIMYHVAENLKNLSDENIEKIADAIIKENDLDMICKYAIHIERAPENKIIKYIIKNGDAKHIVILATELEYAPIDELVKAIINTGSAEHIFYFCLNVINKDTGYNYNMVERLAKAVAQTKNAEYIYKFAENIFGAPISILAKAIIETKNTEYITKFRKLNTIALPTHIRKSMDKACLEQKTDKEKMENLSHLIYLSDIEEIKFNADVYRKLLVDTEEEANEIEEEIKHKKRVLKKEPEQGICIKPQFPGIEI